MKVDITSKGDYSTGLDWFSIDKYKAVFPNSSTGVTAGDGAYSLGIGYYYGAGKGNGEGTCEVGHEHGYGLGYGEIEDGAIIQ